MRCGKCSRVSLGQRPVRRLPSQTLQTSQTSLLKSRPLCWKIWRPAGIETYRLHSYVWLGWTHSVSCHRHRRRMHPTKAECTLEGHDPKFRISYRILHDTRNIAR